MNYAENLNAALIMAAVTLFVMSWDLVPPMFSRLRKVFGK